MTTKTDERGAGRLRRLVPAARPRRRARSQVERLRRLTAWMLGIGIFLAWIGPLGWFTGGTRPVPVSSLALGLLGLAAFTALQTRMIRAALDGAAAHREVAASGAVALAVLLTQDGHLLAWGLIAPAWAAGAALLLNRSATFAATVAATAAGVFFLWPDTWTAFYPDREAFGGAIGGYVAASLTVPWMNRFQLWFWEVVRAAEAGKAAQAQLAVTEERLRFARDLHDLVGHSLSAIAVKSEVAAKLAGRDTTRAAAEMDAVRGLAREALKEIRTAVRGYRTVDLGAELRSMVAVLEAGGIRCTLETPPEGVPEEGAGLLAWVAREGTTNVLRHSAATRCRISVAVRDGTAVLEMVNDGVTGAAARGGTGLIGLSERLAPSGGTVTAGSGRPGEFRLRATVPLEGAR
ncbi:sensor histidine kinase [Planomonospora sp. ID82291]|uniref:sensor histidine kinase n=1 Tax=Planomonospora sp. ID82291 TaxID=2738136 RepID=UPI0018C4381F|nr:sensor histidine kinase [Planomonospora sp. ID82291]MBG0813016.1 sensor histidine kinase [Planomonospora sp. ID82291]